MSLKLIWAGPWNERSAISHFGTEVVRELVAMGHQVEVIRTEVGADLLLPPCPAPGLIHAAGAPTISELARNADGVILNLGNHFGFHGGAMPILRESMPLVILHDAWMGHFIQGWRHAAGDDGWRVDGLVDRLGGGDTSGLTPLCALASGAVVHGTHYQATVELACPGPVAYIPLAYTAEELTPPRPIGSRMVLATIGHVNANKRIDEVIRALSASEQLKNRVLYMLIGPVEPEERARLLALAERGGVPEPHFTGWVPDAILRALITATDVICCLRYPALEGGSASLITAMLSARPTLVSDHASYAEVPDGLVMKCPPGREAAYVIHHLEAILQDPGAAQAMGERARNYALKEFAPAVYAAKLVQALDAATRAAPAIGTGRAIGRRLAELGIDSGDPAVDQMDIVLTGLLRGTGDRPYE